MRNPDKTRRPRPIERLFVCCLFAPRGILAYFFKKWTQLADKY
jgi:hypothetical protein